MPKIGYKRLAITILTLIALGGIMFIQVAAQSSTSPWTPPINVSQSGAASQPVIAAAPNGSLYVMWWDTAEGELFARADLTSTNWTQPASVPPVYGLRKIDDVTKRVTLAPPSSVRLAATTNGEIHALWTDSDLHLFDAQATSASWSNGTALAEAASTFIAASDVNGGLHLAYVRPLNAVGAPPGIYYRAGTGGKWGGASLVDESAYFRTAKPGETHLGVAGDKQDHVIVVWDDPQSGQNMYARSSDGGSTWSNPQIISGTQGSLATQARIATAPNGEFLLQWQETGASGCGSLQRRSNDGGQTWSAPERILSSLDQCPADWTFMPGSDGRLWLIGAASGVLSADSRTAILTAWDGQAWSEPLAVNMSFYDPASRNTINLSCLDIALNGQSVGLVGCANNNDVWAARNAVELDQFGAALKTNWTAIETISNGNSSAAPDGLPAIAADSQGHFYATWSQAEPAGGTSLFAAAWSGSHWSRPIQLLRPTGSATDAASLSELDQP
ncbi:MAG TPA: sialidase family protein, partial [Anaerolineae bacterium]|nr:sialidase family protein [Anaerolineae bacterium]